MSWVIEKPGLLAGLSSDGQAQVLFAGKTNEAADYLKALDADRVLAKQVHGASFAWVSRKVAGPITGCDGMATRHRQLALTIQSADCIPLLVGASCGIVAAAHLGWRGLRERLAERLLQSVCGYGAVSVSNIQCFIGPGIRACCYEVGSEFKRTFKASVAERSGKLYCDLFRELHVQLRRFGIHEQQITDTGVCTRCTGDWFSLRREGKGGGRNLSSVWLS